MLIFAFYLNGKDMITAIDLCEYAKLCRKSISRNTAGKWLRGQHVSPTSAKICDLAFSRFMLDCINFKKEQFARYNSPTKQSKQ